MKTLLPFLFFFFSAFSLGAQLVQLSDPIEFVPYNFSNSPQVTNAKTTACGIDTVYYPTAKATAYSALNINNVTSATAGSQYYDAPQPITISGVEFYAYSITLPTVNARAEIYIAGPDSLPTGGPLASTVVVVDSTFAGGTLSALREVAVFNTPVTVIGPYCVVISNNSANEMGLVANSYTAGDGALENLSGLQIAGNWLNGAAVNVGADPFNADWIFHPLVSYNLTANFVQSFTCLEDPTTNVAFVNLSSNIIGNRMYNQAAYLDLENFSYTWDFDNGGGPVNTFDSIVTFIGTGPFNVSLKDTIFGWTSQCADSKEVLLYGKPTADFSSVNAVLEVAFYDSSFSADNNLTLSWDFGDGNTSITSNPIHNYAVGGAYNVCLYASNACGTDTICKNVAVNCPLANPDFTLSFTDVYTVDFTDVSTNLAAGSTWSWDFDDGSSSNLQNPSHTFASVGIYNVCLSVTNDCGVDSICIVTQVTCNPPLASFTFDLILGGFSYAFQNTSFYEENTPNVLWDFGDGNNATQLSPTHEYQAEGNYEVCLIVNSICGADTTCRTIDVVSGIKDFAEIGASISPNPSNGRFAIVFDEFLHSYTLNVYSSIGDLVHTQDGDSKEVYINISHLNKGIYFLELSNTKSQYLQKLVLD